MGYFFREVHKALHKESQKAVALKRILMHNEKEGMPVTSLREIKILKALNHPCIISLVDMFVVPSQFIFSQVPIATFFLPQWSLARPVLCVTMVGADSVLQ